MLHTYMTGNKIWQNMEIRPGTLSFKFDSFDISHAKLNICIKINHNYIT